MCYPCTQCGACGKYESDLFVFSKPPQTTCLMCGCVFESVSGACPQCGAELVPPGRKRKNNVEEKDK